MGNCIVVSAINICDGGALSVLHDAIHSFEKNSKESDKVYFLVSNPKAHESLNTKKISFLYFPKSKKSWLIRIFYEYIYFYFLSLRIKPDVWFSLHDTTPNVNSKYRYVYCHNPSIFLDFPISDIHIDTKQYLFSKLYKYLYRININKNSFVIVQQNWLAQEFEKIFKLKNIIVSSPALEKKIESEPATNQFKEKEEIKLFYPAYPRYFKNHSIIFETAKNLESELIQFWLTIDGSENKYSAGLVKTYNAKSVKLLGLIPKTQVFELYENCDALLFTSKLETWGLPLSEFKQYEKPILAADLPYAHEAIDIYPKVYWFDPDSPQSLLNAIHKLKSMAPYDSPKPPKRIHTQIPGWDSLSKKILNSGGEQ